MDKEQSAKQIEAIRKITEKAISDGPEACRQLLIDAGIIKEPEVLVMTTPEQKHYGYYQLCPKCNGEGSLPSQYDISAWRVCPVCKGERLLIRPEITTP